MITIAVDAMGGDNGIDTTVPACLKSLEQIPELCLLLVGNTQAIGAKLASLAPKYDVNRLQLVEAASVVAMDEAPSVALRQKRDSSMRIAINQVHDGYAKACVSAGNTGALMAISRFVLKMLPGVDRPAILFPLPSMRGPVHMLDLGANVDCQAEHLFQFAVMGSILVQALGHTARPTVGLLNIGSEAMKGTDAVKQASQMLSSTTDLNYIGYIEGDDIYSGKADVVVCDGFVGNVALKASEGVAKMLIAFAKEEFNKNIFTKIVAALSYPILKKLYKRFDPNNYNGGSLLGLQAVVVKSHGGANVDAFVTAIRTAVTEVKVNVPEKIKQIVAEKLGEDSFDLR